MKRLFQIIFILFFIIPFNGFGQNNAPIAVNDTFYVTFNDSLGMYQFSGSFNISNPSTLNLLSNDSDPDTNLFYIDTAFYNGFGYFSIVTNSINPTWKKSSIGYKPAFNFFGIDSIQYVIKDNGVPIMYDTATIYLLVKRKENENLDLNNINATVGYDGLFTSYSNPNPNGITPGFEAPSGNNTHTISGANLWIAGKNLDSAYASANTAEIYMEKTYGNSGPIMDFSEYTKHYDFDWDRVWKINNYDLIYHVNNWMNGGYQPIEVIANWPAHGDTTIGQAFYLAPFVDNNGDGIYNPYAGDYPKIKGQQAIYFIYNSERDKIQNYSNENMKVEVHGMAYVYNCSSDSAINNTVFVDFKVYNRSNLTFDSTYIGVMAYMNIGDLADDYMGTDVDRNSVYAYNGDLIDENDSNTTYSGYLSKTPAQSMTLLKGAKQDNDGIDNNFGINANETINGLGFGDGISDNEYWGMEVSPIYLPYTSCFGPNFYAIYSSEFYSLLKGYWPFDGSSIVYGGNGVAASTGGTVPCKYLYPNNSDSYFYGTQGLSQPNWTEVTEGNPPGQRNPIISSGPFTFVANGSTEINVAFVFGKDYQATDNESSILIMQERIDSIRSYYSTDFVSVCGGTLGVSENATEKEQIVAVYPNPFNNELNIYYELEKNTATLEVYNLMGEKIKNQLLTQQKTVIDLSNHANGIYFVTIIDGNNRISRKVVKH
ncbi:MAG: hypothetical protein A3K10_03500 [Bacteroidetes bacterium RIFCSPLOWO2_12_FULL_31_6]|nr:MAG: hypothetical protein A3K10_03500 [Bacteroidetes bacterium RIFCSPLOWO2_12_FULL_31_6]